MISRMRMLALTLSLLLLLLPFVSLAEAYSYGPAESEPIVDAYTAALAAANKGNWSGAAAAYGGVSAEVEKDAGGPAATAAWEAALVAKDPEMAARVFQGIVYLNLKRRLTFARQAIADYSKAKTLINRAIATYEGLSPLVKAGNAELDGAMRAHLETTFDALGNPGVLGVGAKAPKPDTFDTAMNAILTDLAPLFPTDFAAMAAGGASSAPEDPLPEDPVTDPPTHPVETPDSEDPKVEDPKADEPATAGESPDGSKTDDPAGSDSTPAEAADEPAVPAGGTAGTPTVDGTQTNPVTESTGGGLWLWIGLAAAGALLGGYALLRKRTR